MKGNHKSYSSDYLLSTQSVLFAGRMLRDKLGSDRDTIEYAITSLEKASKRQQGGGSEYRAFMFSGLDGLGEDETEKRERMAEDMLASFLAEVQTANVLIAAGQVVGETGVRSSPRILDDAIFRLNDTARALEASLSKPIEAGAKPGRFGFSDSIAVQEIKSVDLPSAIKNFENLSNETQSTLVSESQTVASSVVTALSKLDLDKVSEALKKLGSGMQGLTAVGRLIRAGIEKLKGAINALLQLLGNDALQKVKAEIEKFWKSVKDGKFIEEQLKKIFGIEDTKSKVEDILKSQNLRLEALDGASKELGKLIVKFKDAMSMTRRILSAITVAGAVLTFLFGGVAALPLAIAYFVVLAAVILTGMDYADAGFVLKRVRGIREIAQSIIG